MQPISSSELTLIILSLTTSVAIIGILISTYYNLALGQENFKLKAKNKELQDLYDGANEQNELLYKTLLGTQSLFFDFNNITFDSSETDEPKITKDSKVKFNLTNFSKSKKSREHLTVVEDNKEE